MILEMILAQGRNDSEWLFQSSISWVLRLQLELDCHRSWLLQVLGCQGATAISAKAGHGRYSNDTWLRIKAKPSETCDLESRTKHRLSARSGSLVVQRWDVWRNLQTQALDHEQLPPSCIQAAMRMAYEDVGTLFRRHWRSSLQTHLGRKCCGIGQSALFDMASLPLTSVNHR